MKQTLIIEKRLRNSKQKNKSTQKKKKRKIFNLNCIIT